MVDAMALALVFVVLVFGKTNGSEAIPGKGKRLPGQGPTAAMNTTVSPFMCPTYEELMQRRLTVVRNMTHFGIAQGWRENQILTWEILITPALKPVANATKEQIEEFYKTLTPGAAFNVTAYTSDHFDYFQCLYPNYNDNWEFGLNILKSKLPPKQAVPFSSEQCPSTSDILTKCKSSKNESPQNWSVGDVKFNFSEITPGDDVIPSSDASWAKFCVLQGQIPPNHATSLSRIQAGKEDISPLCTYFPGKFGWLHGFSTNPY